jgi:hypothetical protein
VRASLAGMCVMYRIEKEQERAVVRSFPTTTAACGFPELGLEAPGRDSGPVSTQTAKPIWAGVVVFHA